MKFVILKTSAWINGVLRHPHEGAIPLEHDEADRLVNAESAEDVTSDCPSKAKSDATATVTADPAVADSTKGAAK